jgi:putative hemolysin
MPEHRNFNLLHLLWRGIAICAIERNARFLIGCSSLTSQDPMEGTALYQKLRSYLVVPALRTQPRPELRIVAEGDDLGFGQSVVTYERHPMIKASASSKLLDAYLAIGAKICGPPAIDREFGTIDFLTLLDFRSLPAIVRAHFLR